MFNAGDKITCIDKLHHQISVLKLETRTVRTLELDSMKFKLCR